MSGEAAVAMMRALIAGDPFPPAGVTDNQANRDLWAEIAADIEAMPAGMIPSVPSEWTEWTGDPPGVTAGQRFDPKQPREGHGQGGQWVKEPAITMGSWVSTPAGTGTFYAYGGKGAIVMVGGKKLEFTKSEVTKKESKAKGPKPAGDYKPIPKKELAPPLLPAKESKPAPPSVPEFGPAGSPVNVIMSFASEVQMGGDKEKYKQIADGLSLIPDKVKGDIREHLRKIVIQNDLGVMASAEGAVHAVGVYSRQGETLKIGTDSPIPGSTAIHETMHALDVMGDTSSGDTRLSMYGRYSATIGFQSIAAAIRGEAGTKLGSHYIPAELLLHPPYGTDVTALADSGNAEMFAELSAKYLMNRSLTLNTLGGLYSPGLTARIEEYLGGILGPRQGKTFWG